MFYRVATSVLNPFTVIRMNCIIERGSTYRAVGRLAKHVAGVQVPRDSLFQIPNPRTMLTCSSWVRRPIHNPILQNKVHTELAERAVPPWVICFRVRGPTTSHALHRWRPRPPE